MSFQLIIIARNNADRPVSFPGGIVVGHNCTGRYFSRAFDTRMRDSVIVDRLNGALFPIALLPGAERATMQR